MIGNIGSRLLGPVAIKEEQRLIQHNRFGGVGSTLLSGISFVGTKGLSFLTSSIGEIVSLGGALVVFLLTQQRAK